MLLFSQHSIINVLNQWIKFNLLELKPPNVLHHSDPHWKCPLYIGPLEREKNRVKVAKQRWHLEYSWLVLPLAFLSPCSTCNRPLCPLRVNIDRRPVTFGQYDVHEIHIGPKSGNETTIWMACKVLLKKKFLENDFRKNGFCIKRSVTHTRIPIQFSENHQWSSRKCDCSVACYGTEAVEIRWNKLGINENKEILFLNETFLFDPSNR